MQCIAACKKADLLKFHAMPSPTQTLLLTRSDVARLLTLDDAITAVEQAFRLHGERKAPPPGVLGVHAEGGGFHIKAGLLHLDRSYFAAKLNANFFANADKLGIPNIQGVVLLSDGATGSPLAVMDSIEITIQRTGAATAVAAKHLARPDSKRATICGCGNQGRVQLRALTRVLPIEQAFACDAGGDRAQKFAAEMSSELGIRVTAADDLEKAVRQSDVCVTCTPAKKWFLAREHVAPGTFVAAVGADNEDKQELDPRLLVGNKVVVDVLEQCASIGDLHHALVADLVNRDAVHAELGEVVAGVKPGRTTPDEITIFDSTGMALQDVAAAVVVYQRALASGAGKPITFAE
ncbi:MAG: ornithine cyclodeaminase family protein [Acidobacteria bacterium]|nr:ornithine cyclodeaminase family protein [Acidobacteriota bacterium]